MAKILKTVISGEAIYKVASDFEIDNFEIFEANGDELFDETPELLALCQEEPEVPSDPVVENPRPPATPPYAIKLPNTVVCPSCP